MALLGASVHDSLTDFTTSTESAARAMPDLDTLLPPESGITLLDTKNEIFLSYLQTLALRNLEIVRSVRDILSHDGHAQEDNMAGRTLQDDMARDLVKQRVYLDKGVRPLEERLKYQIDKVVRAADEGDRQASARSKKEAKVKGAKKDAAAASESETSGREPGTDEDEELEPEVNELSYRPNPAAFARPREMAEERRAAKSDDTGVYRPPRITATAMPTTEQRARKESRPQKSATLDEYISTELSQAPTAEPSIGSTITAGGRRNKSARERADEEERRDYEETHLTRLPAKSKKDVAKLQGRDHGGYGGEEWRGLGEGLDRIEGLTKRSSGSGSALEKSRKRKATEDRPRGDGTQAGGALEMRRKKVMRRLK